MTTTTNTAELEDYDPENPEGAPIAPMVDAFTANKSEALEFSRKVKLAPQSIDFVPAPTARAQTSAGSGS